MNKREFYTFLMGLNRTGRKISKNKGESFPKSRLL